MVWVLLIQVWWTPGERVHRLEMTTFFLLCVVDRPSSRAMMQVPCNVNKMPLHSSNFSAMYLYTLSWDASVDKSRDALPFKFCYIFCCCLFLPLTTSTDSVGERQKSVDFSPVLRIRDVYPGSRILIFYLSKIPHLGSRIQKPQQNWKLFYFWNAEETNLSQFSKNYRLFNPKICHWALKIMGLGSGIPGPGVKKIPDPDPQHCFSL